MTIRTDHPRIYLTPDRLKALRAVPATDPRRARLQWILDNLLVSERGSSPGNCALGYLLTGNTAYADTARATIQLFVDSGPARVAGDSYYEARWLLHDAALVYDWCYDQLPPAQEAAWRAMMETWALSVWPDTNPTRASGWAVTDPGNNYWQGFLQTGMVGLALFGTSPQAQAIAQLAHDKWTGHGQPYFDKFYTGGLSLEGTNYGTFDTVFTLLRAILSATGEDLINPWAFCRDLPTGWWHLQMPDLAHLYPCGTQSRYSDAPLGDDHRTAPLVLLDCHQDKTVAGQARAWLDRTPLAGYRSLAWQELLWYHDEIPAVPPPPLAFHAAGSGWASARTDWGAKAVMVSLQAGPTQQAHQDHAQGDWTLYSQGEFLATMARIYSHDGLFEQAVYHNVPVMGGLDQSWGQQAVKLVAFEDTAEYTFWEATLGPAYVSDPTGSGGLPLAAAYSRWLLWLKPNFVVLYDRVTRAQTATPLVFQTQLRHYPVVSAAAADGSVRAIVPGETAGQELCLTTWLPSGTAPTIDALSLQYGSGGNPSSYRLNVTAPTGSAVELLQSYEAAAPAAERHTVRVNGAVGLVAGTAAVLWAPPAGPFTYQAPGALRHFVLGVTPGAVYQGPSGSVTASAAGVLAFSVNSGVSSVLLTPGNPLPSISGSATGTITVDGVTHPVRVTFGPWSSWG